MKTVATKTAGETASSCSAAARTRPPSGRVERKHEGLRQQIYQSAAFNRVEIMPWCHGPRVFAKTLPRRPNGESMTRHSQAKRKARATAQRNSKLINRQINWLQTQLRYGRQVTNQWANVVDEGIASTTSLPASLSQSRGMSLVSLATVANGVERFDAVFRSVGAAHGDRAAADFTSQYRGNRIATNGARFLRRRHCKHQGNNVANNQRYRRARDASYLAASFAKCAFNVSAKKSPKAPEPESWRLPWLSTSPRSIIGVPPGP